MWSRVVEIMLGCWLLISPFLFAYSSDDVAMWANDMVSGSAVILFGLLSYWQPMQHSHLLSLPVGGWLIAFAYLQGFGAAPPASQNHLILGMLLLMFAIIPNDADRPAPGWEQDGSGNSRDAELAGEAN